MISALDTRVICTLPCSLLMQRLLTLPRAVGLGFWLYFVQLDNKLQYFWYNLCSEKTQNSCVWKGEQYFFLLTLPISSDPHQASPCRCFKTLAVLCLSLPSFISMQNIFSLWSCNWKLEIKRDKMYCVRERKETWTLIFAKS